jgi:DNA modification methylase
MSIESQLFGVDLFGDPMTPKVTSPVAKKFLVPPFTVLNAREGDWQERKRAWAAMGIKSEIGRGASPGGSEMPATDYSKSGCRGTGSGKAIEGTEKKNHLTYTGAAASFDYYRVNEGTRETTEESGTSIFDPVVCELAYRWFTGEGAQIIDPFAGGSVRGVVASCLGRRYWGCDLRAEQIEANRKQGSSLCAEPMPEWICGDSLDQLDNAPEADFVFSCPPYGDLEEYSDNPLDLSAMSHDAFLVAYRAIIAKACAKLRPDRFACFVVGDFRDKKGNYRNFVSDTIQAFLDAGLSLYNEAILVTSVGSASMRVTRQFEAGRKFCKTHQNVLVFVKGSGKRAAESIKEAK